MCPQCWWGAIGTVGVVAAPLELSRLDEVISDRPLWAGNAEVVHKVRQGATPNSGGHAATNAAPKRRALQLSWPHKSVRQSRLHASESGNPFGLGGRKYLRSICGAALIESTHSPFARHPLKARISPCARSAPPAEPAHLLEGKSRNRKYLGETLGDSLRPLPFAEPEARAPRPLGGWVSR